MQHFSTCKWKEYLLDFQSCALKHIFLPQDVNALILFWAMECSLIMKTNLNHLIVCREKGMVSSEEKTFKKIHLHYLATEMVVAKILRGWRLNMICITHHRTVPEEYRQSLDCFCDALKHNWRNIILAQRAGKWQ